MKNDNNSTGATGRDVIRKAVGTEAKAQQVADALYALGYVCVPRVPSEAMLQAAWADALAEDAKAVWDTMIGVSEGLLTEEGIPKPGGAHYRASDTLETCSPLPKLAV
jgi:hypothetical protein